MTDPARVTDFQDITETQKRTWATGDFNQIGRQNICMAEALFGRTCDGRIPDLCLTGRMCTCSCQLQT